MAKTALFLNTEDAIRTLDTLDIPSLSEEAIEKYSRKYFTILTEFLKDDGATSLPEDIVKILLNSLTTFQGARIGVLEKDNTTKLFVWVRYI